MELHIPLFILGTVFVLTLFVVIWNDKQMAQRIFWLQGLIDKQDTTIQSLHDRLMAKSLNEYQMWKQVPDTVPPPPQEEPFDESLVGHITGKEKGIDAES